MSQPSPPASDAGGHRMIPFSFFEHRVFWMNFVSEKIFPCNVIGWGKPPELWTKLTAHLAVVLCVVFVFFLLFFPATVVFCWCIPNFKNLVAWKTTCWLWNRFCKSEFYAQVARFSVQGLMRLKPRCWPGQWKCYLEHTDLSLQAHWLGRNLCRRRNEAVVFLLVVSQRLLLESEDHPAPCGSLPQEVPSMDVYLLSEQYSVFSWLPILWLATEGSLLLTDFPDYIRPTSVISWF